MQARCRWVCHGGLWRCAWTLLVLIRFVFFCTGPQPRQKSVGALWGGEHAPFRLAVLRAGAKNCTRSWVLPTLHFQLGALAACGHLIGTDVANALAFAATPCPSRRCREKALYSGKGPAAYPFLREAPASLHGRNEHHGYKASASHQVLPLTRTGSRRLVDEGVLQAGRGRPPSTRR